ncbi:MAG: hypothetical protein HY718_20260 [Planctomycetes bacterium]|nr:hypothetical protein [Planctomycetota bacterium]
MDQADFGIMQACFSGHGSPYPAGCSYQDFDGDSDVDGADLALFEGCLGGPDHPPGC